MIGFCTDSNAQLPTELAERYCVEIVPLTVTVDGTEYTENLDLDADAFYARFAEGKPEVATAAPSPGAFAAAYERLLARGCTEVLSIHIGSKISGTLNSARLGAQLVDVPVRLVDTGQASFAISCSVWEAAEAVAHGATIEEAASVAEEIGGQCGNVFIVGALDLARAGGRLATGAESAAHPDAIPVLSMLEGSIVPIGSATTDDEAADAMVAHIRASGTNLRVGVGVADAAAAPLWQALESRLTGAPEVLDVVRYRIGPSVGAHTGPGTAGACYYPAPTS